MNIIEKAIQFAKEKHANQFRKDGKPYFSHLEAVAEYLKKSFSVYDGAIAAAYLHDVIEDQGVTYKELQQEFGDVIAGYVDTLSRRKGENYFDFIVRITKYPDYNVIRIKLADLEHNLSDLEEGSLKDKYRFAHYMLIDSMKWNHYEQ